MNNCRVLTIDRSLAESIIQKHHYSASLNGVKIHTCFGLWHPNQFDIPELWGAAVYGAPAMNNQAASWHPSNPDKCLELRRLACVPGAPKNSESFLIGHSLRWLRKHTDIECVISYADPAHGHQGIIYKASNFKLMGTTSPGKILMVDGKPYHDRTLRNPKPYARKIAERFKNNDPNVFLTNTPGKIIYLYDLRK